MGGLSPWHLAILALVIILLFGAKKLPDAARGLGRSMRIFKSEMKEMQTDGQDPAQGPQQLTQAQPQANAYVTGAATPQAQAQPVQPYVAPAGSPQPTDGRPPVPQPVWDPNTQQYVLPNQNPGTHPQA